MADNARLTVPELLQRFDSVQLNVAPQMQLELEQLKAHLSIQTVELVNAKLTELSSKLDRLNKELGETKAKIETAGTTVSDVTDHASKSVVEGIERFTKAFAQASEDLKVASSQSATTSKRLNRFTFLLAVATVLLVFAGVWQGWQTKRQADIAERQLEQRPTQRSSPALPKPMQPHQ